MSLSLTAEQARQILHANAFNLALKVKEGRTLSASEIAQLQAAATDEQPEEPSQDPGYAKNQNELAEILGVDRRTIYRWRKDPNSPKPRADGRLCVSEWRAFAAARGNVQAAATEELDGGYLKARQTLLQNQKLEHQIAILRKEYVSTEDVEKWGADLGAEIKNVVCQLHLLAPSLAGLQVSEIEDRLTEMETEILSRLHLLAERVDSLIPTLPEEENEPTS